ncbi:MAG TPA: BatA domain-containing protein [Ohtaekwangia sp.]|nr:BatA domain-containing protein [Ohtaekwangia sp.]
MSFLYPSFLWALGVLAIPIIIHLFNFRKTTRVFFSNNRFLKQVKEASTAKRRLKHYLILFTRLLFLFFLVITFCQPIIPAREELSNNRNIILYLDNSQSMSAQMEDKTRGLDAGLSFIRAIVDLFPPDTRYKLITNDFAPFSNAFKTKVEIMDLLAQVRLSPVSRSMEEVADRIRQDADRSQEIFWVADFQKSTLGTMRERPDSTHRLHLVPITFDRLANVFVDSAYLENPFATGGEKNVLRVRVRNDGTRDVDQLNLKLTVNAIQAGTARVDVPQGGMAETSFDLTTGLSGVNRAQVSFNDFPVSFDNEFFLALNFTEKIRVVEIKNAVTPTVVEKVFGNKTVFSYTGFSADNFNYNRITEADLVIVNGLNAIDPSLNTALRNYLNQFGHVLFIPGEKPEIASTKSLLLLPQLQVKGAGEPMELDRPDFDNPFFENVFEERSISLAMPRATKTLDWGNDRSAILRFKNDQPFLSRFEQTGTLYVMACAMDDDLTDFYNHALFVPVMYRIAASGKKRDNKLYYSLRENFISLRMDSIRGEEPLRLVGEQELVPAQRVVGNQVFIEIPKFSISNGFYKLVAARDTVNLLAFNLDKQESLMAQYSGEAVQEMLGGGPNISIFQATTAGAFSNEIKERYLGTPLWKYALLLALLFLVAEVLLIRFLK